MQRFKTRTDGMKVVDIALSEGGYNYYGYLRHNGEWAILRENTAQTEYRYAFGANAYSTAWTARSLQVYTRGTIS